MARPTKNNAEYFSHDAGMRNDPKIRALRKRFTNGYAIYCMLLEVLTSSDYFTIEIDEIQLEILAGDFDTDAENLHEIIKFCDKIKLFSVENGKISSFGLKRRLQPVLDNRNTAKQRFLDKKLKNNNVSVTETTQSKVKESKVKESKDNNSNYYPSTAGADVAVFGFETIENFPEKKIDQKSENEIPVDFELDEEEFAAALKFLKSHSIFGLTKMQHALDDTSCQSYFRVFYEQKKAFGELKNKQPIEVLKHFYQWVPKYKRVLTEKNNKNEPKRNQNFKPGNTIEHAKDFGKL